MTLPGFVIIGAMKCATSTLHVQLAAQRGVFMSTPKEPCFFSDDEVWARGIDWYRGLFAGAPAEAICGESSTHYTKLPTYPRTIERMKPILPHAKLIYIMRHPVDRLISHYIHEWTEGRVRVGIDRAVEERPELIDYGRYAFQIRPWIEAYGGDGVLPVFLERMRREPEAELERVARFIGLRNPVDWNAGKHRDNASSDRLRKGPLLRFIMEAPGVAHARRALVPQAAREWTKNRFFRMRRRPELSAAVRARLDERFNEDLADLSRLLGLEAPLACAGFKDLAAALADPRFTGVGARRDQRAPVETGP